MSHHTLHDKVAIVTGASRGIGARIALTLAEAGAKVVVNYAGQHEAANAVVAEIGRGGGQAIAVQTDVSQSGAMRLLFDAAQERFGRVDILVNNAGIMIHKPLADITDEDYDRLFGINVRGVLAGLQEAATRLSDGGRVINFSSTLTKLMMPGYGLYAATKGAVEQLTRYFAKEVGPRGITANVVLPGPVDTELFRVGKTDEMVARLAQATALGRIGETDDIAQVVRFLASDEARWITAQTIAVNGGLA